MSLETELKLLKDKAVNTIKEQLRIMDIEQILEPVF